MCLTKPPFLCRPHKCHWVAVGIHWRANGARHTTAPLCTPMPGTHCNGPRRVLLGSPDRIIMQPSLYTGVSVRSHKVHRCTGDTVGRLQHGWCLHFNGLMQLRPFGTQSSTTSVARGLPHPPATSVCVCLFGSSSVECFAWPPSSAPMLGASWAGRTQRLGVWLACSVGLHAGRQLARPCARPDGCRHSHADTSHVDCRMTVTTLLTGRRTYVPGGRVGSGWSRGGTGQGRTGCIPDPHRFRLGGRSAACMLRLAVTKSLFLP